MTTEEAIKKLSSLEQTKETEMMIAIIRRLGRVLPWIENEIKYAKIQSRTDEMGTHGYCDAACHADSQYNGGYSE